MNIEPTLGILGYGLGITLAISVVLSLLSLPVAKSILAGLVFSNIIVSTAVHRLDLTNGIYTPQDGDTTLFIYWLCSIFYFIVFIIVYSIKYRSKNCICTCCHKPDYFDLDENNIWDKLI
jgi:hypothetical protein